MLAEFSKINPFTTQRGIIQQPYAFKKNNLIQNLHISNRPKYESTVMALLNKGFSSNKYIELFGNYSDYLCYVPTNLGKEMDFVLIYNNQMMQEQIVSYDIIEVKRDEFDEEALKQLINYESWFLQKKVSGDMKMVRTTAVAHSFSQDVIDYVEKRTRIENKPIKLLKYTYESELVLNTL